MKTCTTCHVENPADSRFCQHCGSPLPELDAAPDDPYVGRLFAQKFRIDRVLGSGAMGRVYLAEHVLLGKKVCIKILHPHLAGDESLAKRFYREARAASRLNHPNSIQIIDFGQAEDGTLFIAMEFLDGIDLRQLIRKEFPLPARRIVRILGQVLSALEEAHDQGIVHRDLKPENIMVVQTKTDRDLVKVLDFGIAKIQEPGPEGGTLTVAGIVCGTPEYMAPEQARGDPLDRRADIYAAGVILYQLLTGELPFKAESALATVTKHLTENPVPPRERRPDLAIDPGLERICLQAMAKDREQRPASALAMKEALEAAVGGMEPSQVSGPSPMPQPPPEPVVPPIGGASATSEGLTPSIQTPLAFAVEEGPPVQRERGGGSLAAWIAAGAIVLLGGAAVALWKLEVGPFAPAQPEAVAATTAKPEAPTPRPEGPGPGSPRPEPARPQPAPPPPSPAAAVAVAHDAGAATAPTEGEAEESERARRRRPAPKGEDPEAALKAALAAAAARPRDVPATTSSPPPRPTTPPARKQDESRLPSPDPIKAQRFYEEALRLLRANRLSDAIARLKDAVRHNPTAPEYHRDLAKAHFRAGNRKHGVWHYRKYLQFWPDAPDAPTIRKIIGQ